MSRGKEGQPVPALSSQGPLRELVPQRCSEGRESWAAPTPVPWFFSDFWPASGHKGGSGGQRPSGQETLVLAVGGQRACMQGSSLQTAEGWAPRGLVSTRTDELSSASCPSLSPQSQGQLGSGINVLSLRSPSPEAPHRAEALLLSSADFFYPQSPISASISRENLPRCTPPKYMRPRGEASPSGGEQEGLSALRAEQGLKCGKETSDAQK